MTRNSWLRFASLHNFSQPLLSLLFGRYVFKGVSMKTMDCLSGIVLTVSLFPALLFAADVVPYSVKSIKNKGSGYVELLGPGKIQVNGETLPYDGTKYIRVSNIGTLSGVYGTTNGCMLAYSSENYTENVSVTQQSCNEVLSVIESSK